MVYTYTNIVNNEGCKNYWNYALGIKVDFLRQILKIFNMALDSSFQQN